MPVLTGVHSLMRIEFGCGTKLTPGFMHHDRWLHSPDIDVAFDLEQLPWPLADNSCDRLRAVDVFEHLRLEVQQWLDECYRVLAPGGKLIMRLPAYDNPYSWRDPTHQRVFHPESFNYWCPNAAGNVWQEFGRYYFGEDYSKWWKFVNCDRSDGDLLFVLCKPE